MSKPTGEYRNKTVDQRLMELKKLNEAKLAEYTRVKQQYDNMIENKLIIRARKLVSKLVRSGR